MMPGNYSLTVYRGDTSRWSFILWADAFKTSPADLTGVTARSQIRTRPGGDVVLTLAPTVSLPNMIGIAISAAQCATLPSRAVWDLQLTYPTGDVVTVIAGAVNATADVTQ
jgi:hypothetical protein